MVVIKRVAKPITHKGKKVLERREPQLVEDVKHTLLIRGRKTTNLLMSCVKDLYSFKKPDATLLSHKNDILPFENASQIEEFSRKYNAPLFMLATSNKKRPNSVIFGRTFQYQLLDMIELGILKYVGIETFLSEKVMAGAKPCLVFAGDAFENKPELKRLKNLLIDMFHREHIQSLRLQGIEHLLCFTATDDGTIFLRSYRILLKKSGAAAPRVELEEIGPSVDFELRRTKLASDDLFKAACKQPKELKGKPKKNIQHNVFGTKEGKIHMQKQNTSKIRVKRMKGLKRRTNKAKNVIKTSAD